uniref:Uncharacterized protein n=1 Tax=Mola mola TaxID=94237 RepID=A0A3Q4AFB4_MOLML
NLTVRGYREDSIVFSNTTTLRYSRRNVSTFIQTDKFSYHPGGAVRLRVVSLGLDNRPYKGRVDISVQDPSGEIINGWESTENLGIMLQEFSLSQTSLLGQWAITATVNVGLKCKNELDFQPTFKINVSAFKATLFTVVFQIYGSTQFFFGKDVLQALYTSSGSDDRLLVDACVTDNSTGNIQCLESMLNSRCLSCVLTLFYYLLSPKGLKVNRTAEVNLMRNTFQLTFPNFPPTLKPSLYFSSKNTLFLLLSFQVSSRGQVLAGGTQTSSSFSLMPTVSWSPEACVTVYCILSDGEVISDTAHVHIGQLNNASLNWSSDKAQPGEQVSLTVTAAEPGSQVGIVVTGMHGDAPHTDLDQKITQFYSISGSDKTLISETMSVPDGVTSLSAVALVMSESLGLSFTPVPHTVTEYTMCAPIFGVSREEIVLEVHVLNHLEHDLEVILMLAQSEAFEFVLADRGGVSVVNAQKLALGSHMSASGLFPIRPVALGMKEISVDGVSAGASDSLVWRLLVKPEGVEQSISETLFLELAPSNLSSSKSVSFSVPPDVVTGSQRASMVLVGDILALSISSLDSLVLLPVGCGEQNMIHFAPSIYVLQYLDKSTQDNKELRSKALGYMKDGYQSQLSYQRDDGSFSAFGTSDTSGNTWLTAFVLRCFLQAQTYMQVKQSVLTRAITWLLKYQGPHGEFSEAGRLIHTEMQGGLDDGPVALTAYVLMALLEDNSYVVSQEVRGYQIKVLHSLLNISNYSLCLVAYALALANSPVAGTALNKLSSRADYRDGVMTWSSSAGLESHDWQPRSAQIEMTSYVLLALFRRGSLVEGIALMKWLSEQRNHLGGYGTTQDTIVALQALAYYAAFSGANAIDLRLSVSTSISSVVLKFPINSTNFQASQSQEVTDLTDINFFSIFDHLLECFQMNIFYNLESKAFSQNLQQTADKEAFSLAVDVTEGMDYSHMLLSVCTRLKDNQVIPQTGMAILDVGMLSGFSLSPGAAAPAGLIRKVEVLPARVSLYLDSVSQVCIKLPLFRDYKVARVQDAVVQVYDYYEPGEYSVEQLLLFPTTLIHDVYVFSQGALNYFYSFFS